MTFMTGLIIVAIVGGFIALVAIKDVLSAR
jgi:hypothetical protein